jgi:hypothetical protein
MNIPERCEVRTKDPRIVCEEKASKITFLNELRQETRRIRVDNCVITEGLRCDFLVISATGVEHFVELKGRDIDHAIEQLEASINAISPRKSRLLRYCFIISSRCPLLTPKIQEFKAQFRKKFNAVLIIKNRSYEHSL